MVGKPCPEAIQIHGVMLIKQADIYMNLLGFPTLSQCFAQVDVASFFTMNKAADSLYHALIDHVLEGLCKGDVLTILEEMSKESGIEQMPCGMLTPADIQVNLPPVIHGFFCGKSLVVAGVHVAKEVP